MSEKKHEPKKAEHKVENKGGNVIQLEKVNCKAEGCKSKPQRAEFCTEHFDWFKMGLLTKEGMRPKDFDKKYQQYRAKKAS